MYPICRPLGYGDPTLRGAPGVGAGEGLRVVSSVAQLLEQRTAQARSQVEAILALDDPELAQPRVQAVLERLFGFWQGTERVIDEWAAREPEFATAARWLRRRRGEVLRHDLLRVGRTVRELAELPEAPPVFTVAETPDVLGWLYVSEAATSGAVPACTPRERFSVRTFTPYLEGPGPMWREYRTLLADWAGTDPVRRDGVLAAAVSTFDALEQWITPLAPEQAA